MSSSQKRARDDDHLIDPPERAKRHLVKQQRKEHHTLKFADLVQRDILPNEYKHTALDSNQDTIRLLRLHPGPYNDSLSCSFEVVSIAEAERLKYEALSYFWGTDEPSNAISLRDKFPEGSRSLKLAIKHFMPLRFNIRNHLYAALRQFRRPDVDVLLWVDALCIDQENEEEKNQQVAKMARIYSSAHHVLIWLGAGDPSCEDAMEFIGEILQLRRLDAMVKDEKSAAKWDSFAELLCCSWFSRRWVVQELALSKNATLHYSTKSVYWTDFADAVSLFVSKADEIRELFQVSKRFSNNPDHLGDVTALGANVLVNVVRNCFRKTELNTRSLHLEPLSSLETLVSNLLNFEASDPRDTVYALLSIVKPSTGKNSRPSQDPTAVVSSNVPLPSPNYTSSAIEVYRDFTRYCTQESGSIDIICRHWAPVGRSMSATTDPIRLKSKKKPKQKVIAIIPSWVPKLTGSPFGNPGDGLNGRSNGESLVGDPDRKRYNASKGKLAEVRFEDHPLAKIQEEPPSLGSATLSQQEEPPSPTTTVLMVDGIADPDTQWAKINHIFYMYAKGFKVDRIAKTSSRVAGGLVLKEWLVMGGWKDAENKFPEEVPDKLWRVLVADRGSSGENPPTWYQRACAEWFASSTPSGYVDAGPQTANSRLPSNVVQFLKRVRTVVWNRVFVTSEKDNRFGLAPQDTRPGDFLCILYGCSVPVIVRECIGENGALKHYQLIGETYIYGLMDGEAFETGGPQVDEEFKFA